MRRTDLHVRAKASHSSPKAILIESMWTKSSDQGVLTVAGIRVRRQLLCEAGTFWEKLVAVMIHKLWRRCTTFGTAIRYRKLNNS